MKSVLRRGPTLAGAFASLTLATRVLVAAPASEPAGALLEIGSDSTCPAPELVNAKLKDILGLSASERVEEVARLVHEETGLVVSLRGKDGRLLGEHALPLEGSCDELGRAAAVVLGSWLTDAHPEFVPAERAHGGSQGEDPTAVAAAAPTASAPPAPSAVPPPPNGSVRSQGKLTPRGTLRARVALAVGAGVVPTPTTIAGSALVALVPEGSGIGATLRAGVVASRALDVDGGQARYFRWPLGAGAVLRFAGKGVSAELEGGAVLAWLRLEGRSFAANHGASDVTFGPFWAARAIASGGKVRPFLEVMGVGWARSARVYVDPTRPSVALPSVDLTAFLGVALPL